MTDKSPSLSSHVADPSQTISLTTVGSAPQGEPPALSQVEAVEEEPYTIKCICDFSDDDGNTIYCERCDTWQHIDCFYPDNREEAIREDFSHLCADCNPRPLNRQKAIERTLRLKNIVVEDSADKKPKRLPTKGQRKRAKTELTNGQNGVVIENGKHGSPADSPNPAKKPKSSHRPSQSVGSGAVKRSPSYNGSRANGPHPPSPATTPPDLPDDFQIHHFSEGFCSLYKDLDAPESQNNSFATIAIPTAMSRWLREPDTMRREVGHTPPEVFQEKPTNLDDSKPKLEVQDSTRSNAGTTLRWRSLKSPELVGKDVPLIELNGEVGFQKDYCANPDNLWGDLSSPLPFVFFHPILPLYIDTRKEGSRARYVRRSCKPNAQLDTYLSPQNEYCFWLVSDRHIAPNEQITLPWDFRLEKSVYSRWLQLLGLSEDDSAVQDELDIDASEYTAISNWIDRILSEYGGCACNRDNNCAFARFHRQYLHGKSHGRSQTKKKPRKSRNHTISPTSTGHATNSRAASEGHGDDMMDHDSGSSRSKPPSRDRTPTARQGSFDQLGILTEPTDRDKRKVQMVEDTFRRMEQQQPPRKKKRISDGSTNPIKNKSRKDSAPPSGYYVDAGTSGSKSGSPSSNPSPNLSSNPFKPMNSRHGSTSRSRQASTAPRPEYCDKGVQTDAVAGEWFSRANDSPRPKKRIVSLSHRLICNWAKMKAEKERHTLSPTPMSNAGTDSPTMEKKEILTQALNGVTLSSPNEDVKMTDAHRDAAVSGPKVDDSKVKTPDLRVQLPPVPAFDNSATLSSTTSTPLSASSAFPGSPFSANGLTNGSSVQPSPVKKKLSLSDYKKSRMNMSGVKAKSTIPSPVELKEEVKIEPDGIEKADTIAPVANAAV